MLGLPLIIGVVELGGHIVYKANVKRILTEESTSGASTSSLQSPSEPIGAAPRATGVQLADGRVFRYDYI